VAPGGGWADLRVEWVVQGEVVIGCTALSIDIRRDRQWERLTLARKTGVAHVGVRI
jgi:hypothetical protein